MADEVEEELVLRDAEDLVSHLHKQAEALVMIKYLEAIIIYVPLTPENGPLKI